MWQLNSSERLRNVSMWYTMDMNGVKLLELPRINICKNPKNKEHDKRHKTAKQATSREELVAPLTWAQRLKRVFNMTGPPRSQPPPIKPATAIQS
jgi:hypothetical protein